MCDATNVVFLSKTCNERSLTHLLPFPKVKNSTLFLIKIHRHTSSALISSPQSYLSFLLSPSLSLSLPIFTQASFSFPYLRTPSSLQSHRPCLNQRIHHSRLPLSGEGPDSPLSRAPCDVARARSNAVDPSACEGKERREEGEEEEGRVGGGEEKGKK